MVHPPSDHFITLVATLLAALPHDGSSIQDEVLLQIHAIFGSMLVSALQLIDRREVVKVYLPDGRYLYQITSSAGSPYTLFAALPDRPEVDERPTTSSGSNPPPQGEAMETDVHPGSSSPTRSVDVQRDSRNQSQERDKQRAASRHSYIVALKRCMEGMYCPCTGYGFNTLGGEKNIFCKHLLALILAHCMNRLIHTEVYLNDVIHLLGLASGPITEAATQASPKKDEVVR